MTHCTRQISSQARIDGIRALGLEGMPPLNALDRIVRIAAHATRSPIAMITFVGESRQSIAARIGWTETFTELVDAFCVRAVEGTALLEIRNAAADDRFRSSKLVTSTNGVRFYAGHPILYEGIPLGTVCVLDRHPRVLTTEERDVLTDLAGTVSDFLQQRGRRQAVERQEPMDRLLWSAVDTGVFVADASRCILAASGSMVHLLGYDPALLMGREIDSVLPGLGPAGRIDLPSRSEAIRGDGSRVDIVVEASRMNDLPGSTFLTRFPLASA